MAIPQKEVVKFIMKDILKKQVVRSQKELAALVNRRLKETDQRYAVSGRRARQIAAELPITITISTREGRQPARCPCCANRLKKIHQQSLAGKKILTGLRCVKCGYRGSDGKWMPGRYRFSR